jgi:AmiR/NasT family two-component response regulator
LARDIGPERAWTEVRAAGSCPAKVRRQSTENAIAAKQAGVNNYIVQPLNAQMLQNKIQSVFPDDAPPPRAA